MKIFVQAVAVVALLCLAACSSTGPDTAAGDAPIELRLMSFNIEWGGTHVSFDNVVTAIRLSGADIVGIQEAEGNLARLAGELGWHYNLQNYVISKFPLLDPPGADRRFVLVEVRPGAVVALANVHLPSDPYGPERVRDDASLDEVLVLETGLRLAALRPTLDALAATLKSGTPAFITGDFNAPSHTDWSETTTGARPHMKYAVDWPTSRAVESAGFRDSWREMHPDPAASPGLTWWAGRPPLAAYAPGANDPQDRIDFIWVAGPALTTASTLAGEPGARDVTVSVSPWPSDHRAVVSTFVTTPAAMPRLLSPQRRIYSTAEDAVITYRNAEDSLIDIAGVGSFPVSGDGNLVVPAGDLDTGRHDIALRTPGKTDIRSDFWRIDPASSPLVETSRRSYDVGEAVQISWKNGPGNRNDYLGIYEAGIDAEYIAGYDGGLAWIYVDALPEGTLRLDQASSISAWPLPRGSYVVRLLKDDGYEVLAESQPFTVR